MSTLSLAEAFDLISNTTIQGAFFGINFALYFLCTQLYCHQYRKAPSDERRKLIFSFIYNSIMVLMAALELGADSRLMQLAYINHGGVRGEPLGFEEDILTRPSAIRILLIVPGFVNGTLNSLMQVCWFIGDHFSWHSSEHTSIVVAHMDHLGNIAIQICRHHSPFFSHDCWPM
jgi:hypothetical protein